MSTDLRKLLRPRVERGAALLDSVEPYWWKRIEEELELVSCKRCVLGQVYGSYYAGVDALFAHQGPLSGPAKHGFDADTALSGANDSLIPQYHVLDDLWLEAIAKRRQS